jgi:alpha-beta hydrolase superfamily lysophospholipase
MLIDTVAIVVVLAVALLAGLIVFGTAAPPKVTDAMRAPFARVELADLPALASFNARDGAALAYRLYSADGSRVILLVHGSAGASESMHALAKALQAAGTTVYAMDVRGRGGSGTPGDIAYVGQLEDDLADVTQLLREKHPAASVSLVGYSSGAGFVLRVAGGPTGKLFDGFGLISPYLGHRAPTQRPNIGGWTVPYVPRLIGLSILDRLGFHALEGLPVVAVAAMTDEPAAPPLTCSYRLARNFHPNDAFIADFRNTPKPMTVVVGAADEVLHADRFAPTIAAVRPDIPVIVLPGLDHVGVITDPKGVMAAAKALGA